MIVFCPNCGTQNPGLAGAKATCTACSSIFDVPSDGARTSPPPVAEAPKPAPTYSAPGAQVFSPPPVPVASRQGARTNNLAVVSLVAGIICCIPFVSPALAIGCGLKAMQQIDASRGIQIGRGLAIAGLILGALTALVQLLGLLGSLSRRF